MDTKEGIEDFHFYLWFRGTYSYFTLFEFVSQQRGNNVPNKHEP